MDLTAAITGAGACRYYRPDPVPDELLARLFDAARFGPQGGNRQPLRYVVVRDADTKAQLQDWYVAIWETYAGSYKAGSGGSKIADDADHFARHLHEVPVLVVVCAVLGDLLRTDSELDRPGVVGGASIYPSVQNLLLTARSVGLGALMTTLLCKVEPQVKKLLGIPDELITAATVAVGYPERALPTKLSRRPVAEVVFSDRFGEALFP